MGGVVGLGLIGGLIAFLLVRKKQSEKSLYALAPQDPNMGYAPYINSVYVQTSIMTPARGFGRLYVCFNFHFNLGVSSRFLFCKDPSDPTTFPKAEHHSGSLSYGGSPDHMRQSSAVQSLTPNYTSGGHNMTPPSPPPRYSALSPM